MARTFGDWIQEIETYEREASQWEEKSKKIIKRYRDDRGSRSQRNRYNILWSNVQTLKPALFNKNPKPNVERRFLSDDKLGSIGSQVLERCIDYFVDKHDFYDVMSQVVLDRLLPGRGTAWVRYVPHFSTPATPEDGILVTDESETEMEEPMLLAEEVVVDYVHWEDFGHTWGRTWQEVDACWRIAYLDKDAMTERFGEEIAARVPYDYKPKTTRGDTTDIVGKKTCIYEIWCKSTGMVYWLHKNVPEFLDERQDPLHLSDFFPFPRPVYATLANDSMIPTPDYEEYRDQANELDEMTARIMSLTKALKVAGVYDSSAKGLERLLVEGVENQLIPVENWAAFSEKGGLKGVISYLPLTEVSNTLLALYQTREKTKQDMYEITGISDIIRGSTVASETATAQNIKGKYASMRLDAMSGDVARFMRDLARIYGEVIAEQFSVDTIKEISGVQLLTAQEKASIQQKMQMEEKQKQMAMQQAQMQGMPLPQLPPAQPLPPKLQEMMDKPTWDDVEKLFKNDLLRSFRIDIQTDSTIKADQNEERDARMQFLQAVGGFMQQAASMQNKEMTPLLMEMLKFGIQGFKVGKDLDAAFDNTIKAMMAPKPPQPNPEMLNIQSKEKIAQMNNETDLKKEQLKSQTDVKIEDMKNRANIVVAHVNGEANANTRQDLL